MTSVRLLISAAAATMVGSAAFAADMPQPLPPQPQIAYQPIVVEQPEGAWYLRGDIGVGIMSQADVVFLQNPLNDLNFAISHSSMGDTTFFMGGVGYEFNNWLRFDVTAEYRSRVPVNFFGTYTFAGGTFGDTYQGFLQSVVFLANAYVDLGTWNCVTPFIGFGIGGARNEFADLTDTSFATPSGGAGAGVGRDSTNLNFAWALHAGLSYAVTQNFSVEFAYRYLDFGSVTDTIDCAGGCNPDSYKLQNLTSQDFMLGFRWRFPIESAPMVVEQQPVMLQQAPVMAQPAPVMVPQQAPMMYPQQAPMMYPQPQAPLSTRG
jgi:opacity protein-like surface antigen